MSICSKAGMNLGPFSCGVGDRFGLQGRAQIEAFLMAKRRGVAVTPVWNKSHREHSIIGTTPADVRREAERAVKEAGWEGPFFVDADHVSASTLEPFLADSDFFTLDVAAALAVPASAEDARSFLRRNRMHLEPIESDLTDRPISVPPDGGIAAAMRVLPAAREAGALYRRVESVKGADRFVVEVSMDETDRPVAPFELFVFLCALGEEGVRPRTIAPRFSGKFLKGVDYVGDPQAFLHEFLGHAAAIRAAVSRFGMPHDLKLSIHSGSDKFSLYPLLGRALRRFGLGLHLKTSGTTWLEELAGLAEAGPAGLRMARRIYREAFEKREKYIWPYATLVEINAAELPTPDEVDRWPADRFVAALENNPSCPLRNPHLRQLLHLGYQAAAGIGDEFLSLLRESMRITGIRVTRNLYERHLKFLFLSD